MKVDLSKAEADLVKVRQQKVTLLEQLEDLTTRETALTGFLNMAQVYTTTRKQKVTLAIEDRSKADDKSAKESGVRFQPHKFPPTPIPEGYKSPSRRMELVRRIAETFDPNSVITAGQIVERIKPVYQIPESAHSEIHHIATILVHEKGPGAAIEKVGDKWRVRPNALHIVQSRIAAEIAEATEVAARRAAH